MYLDWPAPYVVLNTILKRLREHKVFKNKDRVLRKKGI